MGQLCTNYADTVKRKNLYIVLRHIAKEVHQDWIMLFENIMEFLLIFQFPYFLGFSLFTSVSLSLSNLQGVSLTSGYCICHNDKYPFPNLT